MTPITIVKYVVFAVVFLVSMLLLSTTIGINQSGYRTVVQWPNGTIFVKFNPGWYLQMFGNAWEYNDVLTFDFDDEVNTEGATLDQDGIKVRYQDGGLGVVYGVARFSLPDDEEHMLELHKAFRSNTGIGTKLLRNTTEAVVNQTAGLMTSEESYAEKRSTFTQWAKDQLKHGKFVTTQKPTVEVDLGFEFCLEKDLTEELKKECKNVKKTTKYIPVIDYKNGSVQYQGNDLETYGIMTSGFDIVDWDYEDKTKQQISEKRNAQMAIITAKANAERAKQDAITAEQQGLANVQVAKYEQEVEKERQVVIAEREKEVAVINAQRQVDVAAQKKLEQEQNKLAMAEYKQAEILRGEGDAEYKRLVMEADGALSQKLATYERVNDRYATAIGLQKWVPEVQMGVSGESTGATADALISLLTTKTAKDLSLDMSIPTKQ